MVNPLFTVLLLLAIVMTTALSIVWIRRSRHYRKRCVAYTAETPSGKLVKGRYYFKSNKYKPEHEIRAEIIDRLNLKGWYVTYVIIIHIAEFTYPKLGEPCITAQCL